MEGKIKPEAESGVRKPMGKKEEEASSSLAGQHNISITERLALCDEFHR